MKADGPDVLICTDSDGNIHTKDDLPHGTLANMIHETTEQGDDVDGFVVKGGQLSEDVFIFLAKHTSVEWSLIKTGDPKKGKGYITTGHLTGKEPGMRHLLNSKLGWGYTLREFWHSHFREKKHPSKQDITFRNDVLSTRNGKKSRFYLLRAFIPDSPNSVCDIFDYTEYNPEEYYEDLEGIIVTPSPR